MDGTKTAIIYGRVSDPKQAEKELPIASQIDAGHKKAEKLNARVMKVFIDEGISGRRDNRPAFQDAILYSELEQPDYFITWSSSRFARNKLDAAFYKKKLELANVHMVYVSVEIDTSTNEGWLLDGIFELFDELTSRQISTDTKRSLLKNARDGFWNGGRLPFGFMVVPDAAAPRRKRLCANPDELSVVTKIFELKAFNNIGCRGIATWLNQNNISNRGALWTKSTVANLLRNESVVGKTVFGRRDSNKKIKTRDKWLIVESHAPLISLDVWDAVQFKMDKESDSTHNGSPHSLHYFTGLLRCGECGAAMHTESAKGRSRRYWYYNCSAAKAGIHASRRIPSEPFDNWMIDVLCDQVFDPISISKIITDMQKVVANWAVDKERRRDGVIRRLRSLRAAQNNLYSVLEELGKDTPNLGDLTKRLRQNNEQMRQAEQELQDIESEHAPHVDVDQHQTAEMSETLNSLVRRVDVKAARAFFSTFVRQIILMSDHVGFDYVPERLVNRSDVPVPSKDVWLPGKDVLGTKTIRLTMPRTLMKIVA